jgi:hypothetical protein
VTTAGKSYKATFAVVTLPLGVLKAGAVKFTPPLPADKTGAINRLAMGTLNKVILSLPAAAKLPSVNWISRIPLASDKGRWREFFSLKKATGRPVVVAFVAGEWTSGALTVIGEGACQGVQGAGRTAGTGNAG